MSAGTDIPSELVLHVTRDDICEFMERNGTISRNLIWEFSEYILRRNNPALDDLVYLAWRTCEITLDDWVLEHPEFEDAWKEVPDEEAAIRQFFDAIKLEYGLDDYQGMCLVKSADTYTQFIGDNYFVLYTE